MPRASRVTTHKSEHYPGKLEILTVDSEKLPDHIEKFHHNLMLGLGYIGWRLYRARQRASKAKAIGDELRNEILRYFEGLLRGIYGARIYGKRPIEVLVTEQHSDTIIDPAAVIKHLGPRASDLVTGIKLPIEQLMSDPANYAKFVKAIGKAFGKELADGVTITIDRDAVNKLVKDGELEELPEEAFERVVGSRQVRVKMLETADKRHERAHEAGKKGG